MYYYYLLSSPVSGGDIKHLVFWLLILDAGVDGRHGSLFPALFAPYMYISVIKHAIIVLCAPKRDSKQYRPVSVPLYLGMVGKRRAKLDPKSVRTLWRFTKQIVFPCALPSPPLKMVESESAPLLTQFVGVDQATRLACRTQRWL